MKINIKQIFLALRTWLFTEIRDDINMIHTRLEKLELNQLKLIITADETPIKEKLIAGDIYIKNGGNGEIKVYYETLKKEYEEQLRSDKK